MYDILSKEYKKDKYYVHNLINRDLQPEMEEGHRALLALIYNESTAPIAKYDKTFHATVKNSCAVCGIPRISYMTTIKNDFFNH